ncbi:hypothetical protein EMPS_05582 [Entomortierella parvispora]|uniref:Uncharacterized protein n=1 Tax=Entomortierella parvispora TaxID=205924 RepID=A0A9P3LWM9_9FUNG|nr:hypothetical protein EMPS_05582 [Entomortierella parvispora]
MQFKSLFGLATIVAAVSAQTTSTAPTPTSSSSPSTSTATSTSPAQPFESNPCSVCTLSSFTHESSCASLSAPDQALLGSVFANSTVSITNLIVAVNSTAVKNCICHWAAGTFLPTGAAAGCTVAGTSGTPAACNATQIELATQQMAPLSGVIHCDAVVSSNTGASPPASGAAGSGNAGSVVGMSDFAGAVVVVATAALGLGAMVGF